MATKILTFLLLVLLMLPAMASEVKFKDIPANHWAAKSVYDLVKLGITNGYPDGTFRGLRTITRFETAIFISKLAEKLGAGDAARIKEDLNSLKNDIAEMKKSGGPLAIKGTFDLNSMLTNLIASKGIAGKGPIVYYRLQTNLSKDINENASVKLGFDSMDSGYYGSQRDLAKEMMDFEGNVRINPVDLGIMGDLLSAPVNIKLSSGPGIMQHTDATGLASSENGICYIRPETGVAVSSKIGEIFLSGAYLINNYERENSGKVSTNHGEAKLGYNFVKVPAAKNLRIELNGGFYSKNASSGGPRDSSFGLSVLSDINTRISAVGSFVAHGPDSKSWLASAGVNFSGLIAEGMSLKIKVTKVGTQVIPADLFYEELGESGFDVFMRPLENATANIDYDFLQPLTDKLTFKSLGSFRLSPDFGYGIDKQKSRRTVQFGFSYMPATDTYVNACYRVNQDPTISETTDLLVLGMTYNF